MRFASSITTSTDAGQAVQELLEVIDTRLTRGMVDLALLFATPDFEDDLEEVVARIAEAFPRGVIIGCTGEGTLGGDQEIERSPSMSLLAASLPDVQVRPFHLVQENLPSGDEPAAWEECFGVQQASHPTFVAMADPFRLDIHEFISRINQVFPGSPLVGGVASAGRAPLQNQLIVQGEIFREGVVGVALTGQLNVSTVVSQGCRPIGRPFVITKGDRNIIHELGGRSALAQLQDVLLNISEQDEALARQSMFVGRVIDEYKEQFSRGDFLIHNIIGADKKSGSIGIAGQARVGATVQFHVRDADSADEDLRAMLAPYVPMKPAGAMLFGCNGRGTRMWETPGHDVGVLREVLGDVPVGGFFCGGEFGPIGGRNFIHGFTASIALFSGAEGRA